MTIEERYEAYCKQLTLMINAAPEWASIPRPYKEILLPTDILELFIDYHEFHYNRVNYEDGQPVLFFRGISVKSTGKHSNEGSKMIYKLTDSYTHGIILQEIRSRFK